MPESLRFETREAFRAWLAAPTVPGGVWLLFGKKGGPKTLSAAHALEEALCFGWIDGQMQSLDETSYIKYFAPRRPDSQWSEKNRKLVEQLEAEGRLTPAGRAAIDAAKQRGTYEGGQRYQPTPEDVGALTELLRGHEPAYSNFMKATPSVQRTYTGFYLEPKGEEARAKRLATLIERLDLNLNPMESLAKKRKELGLEP